MPARNPLAADLYDSILWEKSKSVIEAYHFLVSINEETQEKYKEEYTDFFSGSEKDYPLNNLFAANGASYQSQEIPNALNYINIEANTNKYGFV